MKAKLIGIDLAKSVFQVCVIARSGGELFNKKMNRAKLILWLKDLGPTTIAMEACAMSHCWGRRLTPQCVPLAKPQAACRPHLPATIAARVRWRRAGVFLAVCIWADPPLCFFLL